MKTYKRNNHPVTKDEIDAIKNCDRLSVNYYNDTAQMTAHIDLTTKYGTITQEVFIPVNIDVKIYKTDNLGIYQDTEIELTACHALIYNYKDFAPYAGTLAQLLKPGDTVEIQFLRQHNGYTSEANLFIFETRAAVLRTNKAGEMHTTAILQLENTTQAQSNYSSPIRFYAKSPAYSETN